MTQKRFFVKEIIKELRLIETSMKKEENIERKIYLFSAAYGIMGRTYRFEFSPDFLLAEFVLNNSYGALIDRFQKLKSGDTTVEIEPLHFEKIEDGLKLLADCFENGISILEPLELILTTAFSTSGPGNYLREKGMLKL
ncbi:hypothetical protein [Methanosarcina sp. MTP4]|uniref:hypothetical protein n=1 Tax=Methanosarcina sp. MTP4 TaxID=1434100 RepID=UPI00064EA6FB|nr:hypothetical protein [Methanosarcina sp. MTP4]